MKRARSTDTDFIFCFSFEMPYPAVPASPVPRGGSRSGWTGIVKRLLQSRPSLRRMVVAALSGSTDATNKSGRYWPYKSAIQRKTLRLVPGSARPAKAGMNSG